jgi:hypothetical protein
MKARSILWAAVLALGLCACSVPQGEYAKVQADRLRVEQERAGEAVRDFPILPKVTNGATSLERYGRQP